MRITFDPTKREKTLVERGLDFADARYIFAGVTLELKTLGKITEKCALSVTAYWQAACLLLAIHRVARIAMYSV